ncbi:MAG: phosphoethanolamine transferase [Deferrisomatales bacterium]|nr:phosphoethanolamine transferase [Deferrisomatales bacterium]
MTSSIVFSAGWLMLLGIFLLFRRYGAFGATFLAGAAWLLYSPSLLVWIEHLGSDSWSEAQNFDLDEALQFLASLDQVVRREGLVQTTRTVALGCAVGFTAAGLALLPGKRVGTPATAVSIVALLLTVGSLSAQVHPAFGAFQSNSRLYRRTFHNFHGHPGVTVAAGEPARDLKVVVYIGESTSALHMGIYGYPRRTTPELEAFAGENEGFLLFYNVFSTHAHTAPSLLEALSIGVSPDEDVFPIQERKRTALVDAVNQAGIRSALISNQGQAGTWNNLASTVVFRNVGEKEFSFHSLWLGELEHRADRPFDKEFLGTALDRRRLFHREGAEIVFLHSYAGHSPYLRNVAPEFREPVDSFLDGLSSEAICGERVADPDAVVRLVQQYDSAVRYIDHSVVSIMQRVKKAPSPSVFVYFSDHGESVYTGRRHDSSRFVHEMVHIPFFVYFNDEAVRQHPDLFHRFRDAAAGKRTSTLAQLPATLLALFGVEAAGGTHYQGVGLDDPDLLPPILTRQTADGYSHVRVGSRAPAPDSRQGPRDATDAATILFRATQALLRNTDTRTCQEGSNTVGKALRGALVASCLWVDVSVRRDGSPTIEPSPKVPAGFALGPLSDIAHAYGRPLVLAGGAPVSPAACEAVGRFFDERGERTPPEVLFLLPPGTPWDGVELSSCIESLRSNGVRTAWEVPAHLAESCSSILSRGGGPRAEGCEALASLLHEVARSGSFTALSADVSLAPLMDTVSAATGVPWIARGIDAVRAEEALSLRSYRIAVRADDDPNSR